MTKLACCSDTDAVCHGKATRNESARRLILPRYGGRSPNRCRYLQPSERMMLDERKAFLGSPTVMIEERRSRAVTTGPAIGPPAPDDWSARRIICVPSRGLPPIGVRGRRPCPGGSAPAPGSAGRSSRESGLRALASPRSIAIRAPAPISRPVPDFCPSCSDHRLFEPKRRDRKSQASRRLGRMPAWHRVEKRSLIWPLVL
jgi:hypothetical protein